MLAVEKACLKGDFTPFKEPSGQCKLKIKKFLPSSMEKETVYITCNSFVELNLIRVK